MGELIGYARVSSMDQNDDRQIAALKEAGCEQIFSDKVSGANAERKELDALKSYARKGDTVVVMSFDRLARNLIDMHSLVKEFTDKGVTLKFLKEGQSFSGNDSPMAKFILNLMTSFAELERSMIRERQREGIVLAKARGAFKGGKLRLTEQQQKYLYDAVDIGVPKTVIAKKLGVSQVTVYAYVNLRKKQKELSNLENSPQ